MKCPVDGVQVFEIEEDVFASLTEEDAKKLAESMQSNTLIRLPKSEIDFFEWLKENDPVVWQDLWGNEEDQYIAAISLLPALINKNKGFPICDLITSDNYYFTKSHIVQHESHLLLESVEKRIMSNLSVSVAQILLFQLSLFPTDIWHFAYRNSIPLEQAKQAVQTLVDDNVLVHLTDAEHLSVFVEL